MVEFGPVNASIHKIDEHIEIASLDLLKNVYRDVLERLVGMTLVELVVAASERLKRGRRRRSGTAPATPSTRRPGS